MGTLTYSINRQYIAEKTPIPSRSLPKPSGDGSMVERLRNRDEAAFMELVERHHGSLVRLAQTFVSSRSIAEEVAQDTWMAVVQAVDRFEARSSLKTWIFQILINRAKRRGVREARSVSFSALNAANSHGSDFAFEPSRFLPSDDPRHPGAWASQPQHWEMTPEQLLLSQECRTHIEHAIADLPELQKEVITLRDIQGWNNQEISDVLGISESNCKVLLHRARSRVRQALEDYLATSRRYGATRSY